ncbi:Hypothetical Protein OBI_RACECAR_228 [Arthrobacter phage Racecar]|nr:hypothetical protein PBI_RACECAR_20 [Arthrobacter phage Racecar]QFG12704.1 hypothetical protein PBI_MIMI_20 [Arthrobacter phage Mimi]
MSKEDSWLVKIRRYDGSESVVVSNVTEEDARLAADTYNEDIQSDLYYAEKWDRKKLEWPPYGSLTELLDR